MKKSISMTIVFIIIISTAIFYRELNNKKVKNSIIYKRINEYKINSNLEKLIDITEFNQNSKEFYFFKGLEKYYNKNIEEASQLLKKSKENYKKKDIIYEIYLTYFLNECDSFLKKEVNIERVQILLKNMSKISILKEDTIFIWNVLSSVATTEDTREKSIVFLENYIRDTKNLKHETILKLKGFIAIFKMLNKNYAESSYIFHEIISESDKIKDRKEANNIKLKAYEYLANMNFILENYEDAIDIYNKIIAIPIDEPKESAKAKYGSHINRTTAYIEIKKYSEARESFKNTQKIIPFISNEIKDDIRIFSLNNLARIEIYEGNLNRAKEILKKCDFLVENNTNKGFFYAELHKNVSYCELYIKEKKYEEALQLLNKLSEENMKNNAGFEAEIFSLKLEIYKNTNKIKEYIQTHTDLANLNNERELMLKKNYVTFIKKSVENKKLKNQEKESSLKIRVLFGSIGVAFFTIVFQIIKTQRLKRKNLIDSLTKIYNRKYLESFYQTLEKQKEKINYNILMIDIDYFKKYNDTYGHIKGDYIIKTVAEILKQAVGRTGSIIRYGGEEFLIISKNNEDKYLEKVCEKIFKMLEKKNIPHKTSLVLDRVTLSLGGVKDKIGNKNDFIEKLKKADLALYEAKENGRNQAIIKNNITIQD